MQLFEMKYLGTCKDKGRGSQAFGWVGGAFTLIFPEPVLRAWFDDTGAPGDQSTLYAVLGMKANDSDPRPFYRRMALQWHPDRCKDPNAHEQFLRIQEAYAILNDPLKRARYDAGLKFAASIKTQQVPIPGSQYRAPLKCGWVMCEGKQSGKWYVVSEILGWEDICENGRILASSWPMGAQQPVEMWI
jgi:hypothetical protein